MAAGGALCGFVVTPDDIWHCRHCANLIGTEPKVARVGLSLPEPARAGEKASAIIAICAC
jgi:hypothetical protein